MLQLFRLLNMDGITREAVVGTPEGLLHPVANLDQRCSDPYSHSSKNLPSKLLKQLVVESLDVHRLLAWNQASPGFLGFKGFK